MLTYTATVNNLETGSTQEETYDLLPESKFAFKIVKSPGSVPSVRGLTLVPAGSELELWRRKCVTNPKRYWLAVTRSEIHEMPQQFLAYSACATNSKEIVQRVELIQKLDIVKHGQKLTVNGVRAFHSNPPQEVVDEMGADGPCVYWVGVHLATVDEVNHYLRSWL